MIGCQSYDHVASVASTRQSLLVNRLDEPTLSELSQLYHNPLAMGSQYDQELV